MTASISVNLFGMKIEGSNSCLYAVITLTSSYSLLLSAWRIIDLNISEETEKNTHYGLMRFFPWLNLSLNVRTFCLRERWSENSSACPHSLWPWRSCCPGPAPCRLRPPHVAGTWGSLPGWRRRVGPRLWSPGLSYWRQIKKAWRVLRKSSLNDRNVTDREIDFDIKS